MPNFSTLWTADFYKAPPPPVLHPLNKVIDQQWIMEYVAGGVWWV